MKKRILALLLATIMVIGTLAGCSNGKEDEKINDDVFWGVGKTHAELEEKYGEYTEINSSFHVKYENAYGEYRWVWGSFGKYKDTKPTIEDIGGCYEIIKIKPQTIFWEATYPFAVTDLEEIGMKVVAVYRSKYSGYAFAAQLQYLDKTLVILSNEKGMVEEDSFCKIINNKYSDSPICDGYDGLNDTYKALFNDLKTLSAIYDKFSTYSGISKLQITEISTGKVLAYEDMKDVELGIDHEISFEYMTNCLEGYFLDDFEPMIYKYNLAMGQ